MDVETAEAIDRLGDRIDAVHLSLGAEVADVLTDLVALRTDGTALRSDVTELRSDVTELRSDVTELRSDVTELRSAVSELRSGVTELRSGVTELRTDVAALRTELHQGLEDGRRYALMLNESTAHDIRLVAEGVAALAVKIDSLHR